MDTKPIKKPNFIQAILVLGVIVAILMLSITVWDVTIQIALLISIIIACKWIRVDTVKLMLCIISGIQMGCYPEDDDGWCYEHAHSDFYTDAHRCCNSYMDRIRNDTVYNLSWTQTHKP